MDIAQEVQAIADAAIEADVSMVAVLKRSGVNYTTWWRWRRGDASPVLAKLHAVRAALNEEIEARA